MLNDDADVPVEESWIAAREAQVIGDGPRVSALPNEGIDQAAWDVVNRLRASAGIEPTNVMPEYGRTILKNRALFERQLEMGSTLFRGSIPHRERELAILRCAWLCRAPFEWGEHVAIAKRFGVTSAEIERITQGGFVSGWSRHDSAVVRGVDELVEDQAISDCTWNALARSWTEAQLIEFPYMVGQYVAIAFLQNTLRTALAPGNAGLRAR